MIVKKILDALSLKAVRHRLDKRKLQEELDLHRLYLITAYHHRVTDAFNSIQSENTGEEIASILDVEAQKLGSDGLRSQVSSFLSHQLYELTKTLHKALVDSGDDAGPAKALADLWRRQEAAAGSLEGSSTSRTRNIGSSGGLGLGLGFAASAAKNSKTTKQLPPPPPEKENFLPSPRLKLTPKQVSEAFLSLAKFTLHVSPSSVPHTAAGQGLFLQGTATVGQIVAMYPGVSYSPLYHRHIPGYPLVARSNPFLLSRYDGVVLDAKPWGEGVEGSTSSSSCNKTSESKFKNTDGEEGEAVELVCQNAAEEGLLTRLERRNPLALAHYANHPPAGTPPNVMVAAVDWRPRSTNLIKEKEITKTTTITTMENQEELSCGWELRAYVPTVDFCSTTSTTATSSTAREFGAGRKTKLDKNPSVEKIETHLPRRNDAAPCVALVALRNLENEELFLNYRLNPNAPGGLPDWYVPVDVEEDTRRWA
ncbi:hypothetical protein Ndes2437B_g06799 [Nannochloris sp. 'desiccata']